MRPHLPSTRTTITVPRTRDGGIPVVDERGQPVLDTYDVPCPTAGRTVLVTRTAPSEPTTVYPATVIRTTHSPLTPKVGRVVPEMHTVDVMLHTDEGNRPALGIFHELDAQAGNDGSRVAWAWPPGTREAEASAKPRAAAPAAAAKAGATA